MNTYYIPGVMLGVGNLEKYWTVPVPRHSVQWEEWQLNQLQSSVMNVTVEVPACQEHRRKLSLPRGEEKTTCGRKLFVLDLEG